MIKQADKDVCVVKLSKSGRVRHRNGAVAKYAGEYYLAGTIHARGSVMSKDRVGSVLELVRGAVHVEKQVRIDFVSLYLMLGMCSSFKPTSCIDLMATHPQNQYREVKPYHCSPLALNIQ